MLKFALKNMAVHRARVLLVALSIVLSACVALLSFNIAQQVNEGIVNTAAYYDLIIGPAGSATQLAMNTLFFTDEPLGTLDYAYVEEIESSGLANAVVPFTMGDSFGSAKIVGTTADFLAGKSLASGTMFTATYEAVVGSAVAQQYGLNVGDEIVTSHGLTGTGSTHEAAPLTVTGILQATGTAYDNVVFTHYETVWAVHSQGHTDEDEEEPHVEGEICAILVKSKSFNDYYRLLDAYSGDASLLCINPSTVLREVLEQVDTSSKIVYALCAVVLLMNIVVISVITLLNMYDAQKEIALMRLIGISMRRIAQLYLIQNGLIGLAGSLLALLCKHLLLGLMGNLVASMGIVLNVWRTYPQECAIAGAVFVLSVLPTMARIFAMARKDGLTA